MEFKILSNHIKYHTEFRKSWAYCHMTLEITKMNQIPIPCNGIPTYKNVKSKLKLCKVEVSVVVSKLFPHNNYILH